LLKFYLCNRQLNATHQRRTILRFNFGDYPKQQTADKLTAHKHYINTKWQGYACNYQLEMEPKKSNKSTLLNRYNYCKYYRVDKNDTLVKEVSVNDFEMVRRAGKNKNEGITLQHDAQTYSMYTDLGQAMEKAKAGARAHIEELIAEGEEGLPALLQYRMDHYEDLNINLVDANIQKEEREMKTVANFEYKPYRIGYDTL